MRVPAARPSPPLRRTYACVRHAAITTAFYTRRFTRRVRVYNTVNVWRIIPHVSGVDYRERDVSLRDS